MRALQRLVRAQRLELSNRDAFPDGAEPFGGRFRTNSSDGAFIWLCVGTRGCATVSLWLTGPCAVLRLEASTRLRNGSETAPRRCGERVEPRPGIRVVVGGGADVFCVLRVCLCGFSPVSSAFGFGAESCVSQVDSAALGLWALCWLVLITFLGHLGTECRLFESRRRQRRLVLLLGAFCIEPTAPVGALNFRGTLAGVRPRR